MKKLLLLLMLAVASLSACGGADKTSSSQKGTVDDYDNVIELPEDDFN